MSKVQIVRSLLKQRLPADDEEEIIELFERTTAEYEEELCGLKEENERQRKLLDAAFNSDDKTDVHQLLVKEAEVPLQQQSTSNVDQESPELHDIKNEERELWTYEEREHLQVLKVNSCIHSNDDAKLQSSCCHQLKSEEVMEVEPRVSSSVEQTETEDDNEDWGREKAVVTFVSYVQSHSDATVSRSARPESRVKWEESKEPSSCLNSRDKRCKVGVKTFHPECEQRMVHKNDLMTHNGIDTGEKLCHCSDLPRQQSESNMMVYIEKEMFKCTKCAKAFRDEDHLKRHMPTHGNTSFMCPECGKTFKRSNHLKTHMLIHTGERPFSCSECEKTFYNSSNLKAHLRIHTSKRRFSCSECEQTFNRSSSLKIHMQNHTGERPFSCSECGKRFNTNDYLKSHMLIHTGERPFHCTECGKTFNKKSSLKTHMLSHTGEGPIRCSECGKTFNKNSLLKIHMLIHTGEKPFTCSECGKKFNRNDYLKTHMTFHKGYKLFHCSECGKAFVLNSHLKRHMNTHTRSGTHCTL